MTKSARKDFGPASRPTGETQDRKLRFGFARSQASLNKTRIRTQTFRYQVLESGMGSWDGVGQAFKEHHSIIGKTRFLRSYLCCIEYIGVNQ
jgi:hypothetical protein